MLQKNYFQARTALDDLTQILAWFDQLACDDISARIWLECQLALSEGFTNAVRHAHREMSVDTPIDIEVTFCAQGFEIRIWDHGPPFDLEQILKQLPDQIYEESEGGRGLKIITMIADQITYTRTADQRNCLLIKKYGLLASDTVC